MNHNDPKGRTRRELLAAMAVSAAAPAGLGAQEHQHESAPVQIAGAYKPKVLTPAEMKWLNPLVDAIIPRTDTPGASDAGVPASIDRRMAGNASLTARIRKGMAALDADCTKRYQLKFAALDTARATEVLTALEAAPESDLGTFFRLMKDLTIDGYYSSREGLVQELGWHGNTYLTEFIGCTHPEHQS